MSEFEILDKLRSIARNIFERSGYSTRISISKSELEEIRTLLEKLVEKYPESVMIAFYSDGRLIPIKELPKHVLQDPKMLYKLLKILAQV